MNLWQYPNDHNAITSESTAEIIIDRKNSNRMDCLASKRANFIKEEVQAPIVITKQLPSKYKSKKVFQIGNMDSVTSSQS